MKGAGEVRNLRKAPHALAAVEYLRSLGATDVLVMQKGHLHISWFASGTKMSITLSSTPRVPADCAQTARQLIRRRFRENGISVAA